MSIITFPDAEPEGTRLVNFPDIPRGYRGVGITPEVARFIRAERTKTRWRWRRIRRETRQMMEEFRHRFDSITPATRT